MVLDDNRTRATALCLQSWIRSESRTGDAIFQGTLRGLYRLAVEPELRQVARARPRAVRLKFKTSCIRHQAARLFLCANRSRSQKTFDKLSSGDCTMIGDRQSKPLNRVLRSTFIVLSDKSPKLECTARNISRTGATLRLSNTSDLPRVFDVVINGHRQRCRLIWRTDREIGIRFELKKAIQPGLI